MSVPRFGVSADEQWWADELAPTWIERGGFPDGSIAHPALDAAGDAITAGSVAVTDAQMCDVVAFAEFLAGHAFTEQERTVVRRATLDELELAPEPGLERLVSVGRAVRNIRLMAPVQRVRQRTAALQHLVQAEERAGVVSDMMRLVRAYHPPAVIDLDAGVVITGDTFAALGSWRRLVAAIAGVDPQLVWDDEAELVRLEAMVAAAESSQLEPIARAQESLVLVRQGLRAAGVDHRLDFVQTIRDEVRGPDDVRRVAAAMGQLVRITDLVDAVGRLDAA